MYMHCFQLFIAPTYLISLFTFSLLQTTPLSKLQMANYKFIILILFILFSCDILNVEGRKLNKYINFVSRETQDLVRDSFKQRVTKNLFTSKSPTHFLLREKRKIIETKMEMDVDSFRPTAPGRSPGAGH